MSKRASESYNPGVNTTHKYRRIAESLRQKITSGSYVAGDFLPTTKQLAEDFETTTVTIDRAIGLLVTEGLVTRTPGVGTTVERRFGDAPPAGAETGLVGALLQAQTDSHYWERLIEGINDVLRPAGFSTLIGYHNQDHAVAMEHARLFQERGASLVFFTPVDRPRREEYERDNARIVGDLREMGFTVIMLDRYVESAGGHFVSERSYDQGVAMMEALTAKGFHSPLCVSTDYVSVIESRERSFIDGCARGGVDDGAHRIVRIPLQTFQARDYARIEAELAAFSPYDIVVCLNSRIFNTMIYLLAKRFGGADAGPEIRLAGFVDYELMDLDAVEAYVEQPVREVGRAAGRLAQRVLEQPGPEIQHSFVPCELRVLED